MIDLSLKDTYDGGAQKIGMSRSWKIFKIGE